MADYRFKTAHNQADIILQRRRNAIAVYEKDRVTTIETGQRLQAQRFLNSLKKSEMLLKEHESTKTMLLTRRQTSAQAGQLQVKGEEEKQINTEKKKRPSSWPGKGSSEPFDTRVRYHKGDEETASRAFSAKLKTINQSVDVPFVKLSSYTRDDLRRPATALELKRKGWEKMSEYFEKNNDFRVASKMFAARCAANVPRRVLLAREKLHAFTNLEFLSKLPQAPPRVDVAQAQIRRRDVEKIEKEVVTEFCDSLEPLKTNVPESFGWMDVNEVYSKNEEIKRLHHPVVNSPRKAKQREERLLVRKRKNGRDIRPKASTRRRLQQEHVVA